MTSKTDSLKKYATWLKRQPLSDTTKRAYVSRIKRFQGFLDASGEDIQDLLKDKSNLEMVFVLKSYKIRLKKKGKLSPATVNAHLTAIDHYLQYLGIARIPEIPREDLPQEAPKALSPTEQKRFLRAVAGCRRSKDRALALLMFYTGIRIGECADLDIDDLFVVGRKRKIVIRSGKGDRYREIPLNEEVCDAARDWLRDRAIKYGDKEIEEAVFLNPQGGRMSTAGLDLIVRKIGEACGIALSAHILRHTLLTNLVRNGNDLVLVAEIGGHSKLETTRRYSLPTVLDKEKAMSALVIE